MPVKKTKKIAKPAEEKAEKSETAEKYFFAIGKRKTSVAQVRIYKAKKSEAEIIINGKDIALYFPLARLVSLIQSPLAGAGQDKIFDISVRVRGGGVNSQAEAIRLGIARALVKYDETLRKSLKDLGFLTRDARIVERKKPGLKKARRAPQWAKR